MEKIFLKLLFLLSFTSLVAQNTTHIQGIITDENSDPLGYVTIVELGTNNGTIANDKGEYSIAVSNAKSPVAIHFSYTGKKADTVWFDIKGKSVINYNKQMSISQVNLGTLIVSDRKVTGTTMKSIDISQLNLVTDLTGADFMKTLSAVSSRNELSSQYSVRGGNFDENLIYVNDIEIYRPLLIRSGQQEGLSFINSDMVSSINFSAGGFDARYGDKMSSVLDITYKRPKKFGGGASASLLGGKLYLQGLTKNKRLTHITGVRYKTSQYLLSSLDIKGEYKPTFVDVQTYITYALGSRLDVSFLGNYTNNKYNYIPETRSTEFGTFQSALNLNIYYEGQETDQFNTTLGALTFDFKPTDSISLKFITSVYSSMEEERYDILGEYYINQLDKQSGSETFGDSLANIGVGGFLNHARNYLTANVISIQHNGVSKSGNSELRWGINIQKEIIDDKLNEWEKIDSAGFSLRPDNQYFELWQYAKAHNELNSNRIRTFVQNSWKVQGSKMETMATVGGRLTYWTLNNQFTFDPRVYFGFKPQWQKDILFSFATGLYSQPAFYKEMRYADGSLNTDLRAQKSYQIVLGSDYNFFAMSRPFKFTAEIYYKYLYDLVPYKIENVRLQYMAENNATGYATGIDFKVNGQFVPDAESWVSLSLMQTHENQPDDTYIDDNGDVQEIGSYARPSNQLVSFGLFFQDYLPNNPSFKVHLNFVYGSKMPLAIPYSDRYDSPFRFPPYRRVDIGFSKVLKTEEQNSKMFNNLKNIWISAEIFNLFDVNNTISYHWIKTVSLEGYNRAVYAVPNYLTSRRLNVKLTVSF